MIELTVGFVIGFALGCWALPLAIRDSLRYYCEKFQNQKREVESVLIEIEALIDRAQDAGTESLSP